MMRFFYDVYGEVCAFSEADLQVLGARIADYKELTPEQKSAHLNPSPLPASVEQLKTGVTAYRWEVETGGITLSSGMRVATGEDDQRKNSQALTDAKLVGFESINFSTLGVWYTLTILQLEDVVKAVAKHRQACRDSERAHHEAIDVIAQIADPQERQAALDAYDESQGWPIVAPQ